MTRVVKSVTFNIYCICRGPETLPMVMCDQCTDWFHPGCLPVNIPAKAFKNKCHPWKCPSCTCKLALHNYTCHPHPRTKQYWISYYIKWFREILLCPHAMNVLCILPRNAGQLVLILSDSEVPAVHANNTCQRKVKVSGTSTSKYHICTV